MFKVKVFDFVHIKVINAINLKVTLAALGILPLSDAVVTQFHVLSSGNHFICDRCARDLQGKISI